MRRCACGKDALPNWKIRHQFTYWYVNQIALWLVIFLCRIESTTVTPTHHQTATGGCTITLGVNRSQLIGWINWLIYYILVHRVSLWCADGANQPLLAFQCNSGSSGEIPLTYSALQGSTDWILTYEVLKYSAKCAATETAQLVLQQSVERCSNLWLPKFAASKWWIFLAHQDAPMLNRNCFMSFQYRYLPQHCNG